MIKLIKNLIQTFLNKTGIFNLIIKKFKFNYPADLRFEIKKIISNLNYNEQKKIISNQYDFLNINLSFNKECKIELASEK